MGFLTSYAVSSLLKHFVGKEALAKPTTYVALFTNLPTSTTQPVEVSSTSTGYARAVVNAVDWEYDAATRSVYNKNYVNFNTSLQPWGTIQAIGIYDSLTGGNLLWYAYLPTTVSVSATEGLSIAKKTLILEFFQSTIFVENFLEDVSSAFLINSSPTTLSISASYDKQVGYQLPGSLALVVSGNSAVTSKEVIYTNNIACSTAKKYSVNAQCQTTNSNLVPKLFIKYYNSVGALVGDTVVESVSSVSTNIWELRTITDQTPPSGATSMRIGISIFSTNVGNLGTIWLDNLRVVQST